MGLNNKVGLGVIGEKFSDSVAKSIFKVKEGYRVKHVDWDNYSYGHGLDYGYSNETSKCWLLKSKIGEK